jgi:hypothetical protein
MHWDQIMTVFAIHLVRVYPIDEEEYMNRFREV